MKEEESILQIKKKWNISKELTVGSRGASRGLCTLWNSRLFQIKSNQSTLHWIQISHFSGDGRDIYCRMCTCQTIIMKKSNAGNRS